MRLCCYNILEGGEGRADPLAEVILAQRADIVTLVEADNVAVLERIASRLKMDYVHAPGKKSSVAVLSRWPILESINYAPLKPALSKAFLEVTIQERPGVEWSLGVVHLHAHALESDESEREQELNVILDTFAAHRDSNRPHLLLGDFNSNAPGQVIDPERCKPSTREELHANGGKIPRRVVQRLLDAGYLDSLPTVRGEEALETGTFSTQFPGQRVDYCFTHGIDPKRLTHAWIETDRLAKYASDHFPIGLEIA